MWEGSQIAVCVQLCGHVVVQYKVGRWTFIYMYKQQKSGFGSLQVFVHNQKITVGPLQVQVVECTRLPVVEHASEVFCTVNVGKLELHWLFYWNSDLSCMSIY